MSPNIPGYRTEAEAAKKYGKTVRTMQLWRQQRVGPPYVKLGNTVMYPDPEGDKWLRDQVQQPVRSRRSA